MQRQTPQVVRALIISDDGGEENESNWDMGWSSDGNGDGGSKRGSAIEWPKK